MVKTNIKLKQNPAEMRGKAKPISDGGKTIEAAPPVVNPAQTQVTLRIIPIEVRNVPVAVRVLPTRTNV